MDKRLCDIKLGASVVVGIFTLCIVWSVYKGFRGSTSLEKA